MEKAKKNGRTEIDRVIGIALGVIGLSMRDTLSLTLDEFAVLHEEWDRWQTARYRTGWEQTRFIGQCSLAPYMKRGTAHIVEFDWEKKRPLKTTRPDQT